MRSPWLVDIAAPEPLVGNETFYAVPHAGAGAAAVRDLCRRVGRHASAAAVRLPAREARLNEAPMLSVDEIATHAAEAIATHSEGRPITMYGHCSGAIIAFEVVRRLPPNSVRSLFVSSHQSPDRIPQGGFWRKPTGVFLERVAADGYVPAFILEDEELLEMIVPALRADYQAIESYQVADDAKVSVDIVGLLGDRDATVPLIDFESWADFTTGSVRVRQLPGAHNLLLDHTDDVADVIMAGSAW